MLDKNERRRKVDKISSIEVIKENKKMKNRKSVQFIKKKRDLFKWDKEII